MSGRTVMIVGGSDGIGLELAKRLVADNNSVVVTSRSEERARNVAADLGPLARGLALDLSEPEQIAARVEEVPPLDGLVLSAIERDANTIGDFNLERARYLMTMKVLGYAEVVHALVNKLRPSGGTGVVLFGGRAKDAPYPGSTTVSTVNGAIDGLMSTLAVELAPVRVNSIHPGIVGDSPFWADKPEAALAGIKARTPGGKLVTVRDIVDATRFLLWNEGMSGHSLNVDLGWRTT